MFVRSTQTLREGRDGDTSIITEAAKDAPVKTRTFPVILRRVVLTLAAKKRLRKATAVVAKDLVKKRGFSALNYRSHLGADR